MKKSISVLVMLFFIAGASFAQSDGEVIKFTLKDAVRYALINNEAIVKAQLDERGAEYKIQESIGSGLPQLSANGQLNSFPERATQLLPGELAGQPGEMIPVQFGTKYSATGGIELQQLLFSKSFFVGLEAANTTKDLYRLRTQMSEEEVIYNVSSSFLQLLQTKQQFQSVEANYARLEQLEQILLLQYENDIATKVQVNRVIVNKTNLENQRKALNATYQQQLNGLKYFMNMPMGHELNIDGNTEVLDISLQPNTDIDQVMTSLVDYKLLTTQKSLYSLNMENIKAGYYPRLSAFAQGNLNAQRNEFNFFSGDESWFKAITVGLQLNIPIFDGFQRKNQIRQAKIEVDKVDQDLRQLKRATDMNIRNAIEQINTSLTSIESQKLNVELAKEVYNNTNELYKEGLAPLTDLLDVEVSLREAETNLNNERLRYQLSQLTYIQAKGDLKLLTQ
ncbi:TolC family protein [Peijinzhouia sedimentorum]